MSVQAEFQAAYHQVSGSICVCTCVYNYSSCVYVYASMVRVYVYMYACTGQACTSMHVRYMRVRVRMYGTCAYVYACAVHACTYIHLQYTVQLTRNLNASVEYERFYSRVSMCETRALVLELHSKIGPLALERSSTRTRLDSTRTSQLDIRIRAIEHRTRRYYNYIHARTGTYKLHARTHMAHERYRHPLRTRAMYSTTARG